MSNLVFIYHILFFHLFNCNYFLVVFTKSNFSKCSSADYCQRLKIVYIYFLSLFSQIFHLLFMYFFFQLRLLQLAQIQLFYLLIKKIIQLLLFFFIFLYFFIFLFISLKYTFNKIFSLLCLFQTFLRCLFFQLLIYH